MRVLGPCYIVLECLSLFGDPCPKPRLAFNIIQKQIIIIILRTEAQTGVHYLCLLGIQYHIVISWPGLGCFNGWNNSRLLTQISYGCIERCIVCVFDMLIAISLEVIGIWAIMNKWFIGWTKKGKGDKWRKITDTNCLYPWVNIYYNGGCDTELLLKTTVIKYYYNWDPKTVWALKMGDSYKDMIKTR